MPTKYGRLVTGRVARGDRYNIVRRIKIKPSYVVSKAWLTVKNSPSDADPGVFQKIITTTPSSSGQIIRSGSDGIPVAILSFSLSTTNTEALTADVFYWYDIKVLYTNNELETVEYGKFSPYQPITRATS
jgi:hypothetical protein